MSVRQATRGSTAGVASGRVGETHREKYQMAKRVLASRFMHETKTFSRVLTDMASFRRRDFQLENQIPVAFRDTRSALGATFEAADKYGWRLIHPVSASVKPSGLVTRGGFE